MIKKYLLGVISGILIVLCLIALNHYTTGLLSKISAFALITCYFVAFLSAAYTKFGFGWPSGWYEATTITHSSRSEEMPPTPIIGGMSAGMLVSGIVMVIVFFS